jgi:hypothetical protein
MPSAVKPGTVPPAPVAATSFATPAASGQTGATPPAAVVAPAVVQGPLPATGSKQPVVTTLSILPEPAATVPAAVPAAAAPAPVVRSKPIETEKAASNPNQGRSGWIFVR